MGNSINMSKILLALTLFVFSLVNAGDGRIGDTCHIQNDCESFCCSSDDGGKGKCVAFESRDTCKRRGEVDEFVLWSSLVIIAVLIVICAFGKVRQQRHYD